MIGSYKPIVKLHYFHTAESSTENTTSASYLDLPLSINLEECSNSHIFRVKMR